MHRLDPGRQRNRRAGFTLVEVLVVVLIMGILAAIGVPTYREYLKTSRLKGAARQVMSELMSVRMQAVAKNHRLVVTFVDNHRFTILADANNNLTADMGEATVTKDIQADYYDVTLAATANPVFEANGMLKVGTNTTVTLTSASTGATRCVKAAVTGRVVIDPSCS